MSFFKRESDPFMLIDPNMAKGGESHQVFEDYQKIFGSSSFDPDLQVTAALRERYPEHIITAVPNYNLNLLSYAAFGNASAKLDQSEGFARFRGYIRAPQRGGSGTLGDAARFAKYDYKCLGEDFILYTVQIGVSMVNYILKEPEEGESITTHSKPTDALLKMIGDWQMPADTVYVFDGYWQPNRGLWEEVQKAKWEDVILADSMKKSLQDIVGKFYDKKSTYEDLGVPWKRGIMFHGPPGNGKTIVIKALMHDLSSRKSPVPSLYVKSISFPQQIGQVFMLARMMSPCLLIFEDIESIVTQFTRSYFFNEVDGLENNDGILMIASTNYLERIDPGLSKRPSRFDRKFFFALPTRDERELYCSYWRNKLKKTPSIKFPKKLLPAMAGITENFSFAYMKEAFVATLLIIANNRTEAVPPYDAGNEDDLDDYELWVEFREQVLILREDMESLDRSVAPTNRHTGHAIIFDTEADEDTAKHIEANRVSLPLLHRASPRVMNTHAVAPQVVSGMPEHSFGAATYMPVCTLLPDVE